MRPGSRSIPSAQALSETLQSPSGTIPAQPRSQKAPNSADQEPSVPFDMNPCGGASAQQATVQALPYTLKTSPDTVPVGLRLRRAPYGAVQEPSGPFGTSPCGARPPRSTHPWISRSEGPCTAGRSGPCVTSMFPGPQWSAHGRCPPGRPTGTTLPALHPCLDTAPPWGSLARPGRTRLLKTAGHPLVQPASCHMTMQYELGWACCQVKIGLTSSGDILALSE